MPVKLKRALSASGQRVKRRIEDGLPKLIVLLKKVSIFVRQVRWQKVTDLKLASRTLAVLIFGIAGGLGGVIGLLVVFASFVYVASNLWHFIFILGFFLVTAIGFVIATFLFPKLMHYIQSHRNKISGFCVKVAIGLWFMLFSHWAITEKRIAREIALTLCGSSALLLIAAITKALVSRGRLRIIMLVAGFVCIILFYGGIYNFVFLWRPFAFSFSQGIAEGVAIQRSFADDLSELRAVEYQQYLATMIESNPQGGYAAVLEYQHGTGTVHEVAPSITIECVDESQPMGSDKTHLIVHHRNKDTSLAVRSGRIQHPEYEYVAGLCLASSTEDFRTTVGELIGTYQDKIGRMVESLEGAMEGNPQWGVLDFCYFSATTMTTVGFGDILPNSALVRMIVMSQAILGVAYIGLGLALLRGE